MKDARAMLETARAHGCRARLLSGCLFVRVELVHLPTRRRRYETVRVRSWADLRQVLNY